MNESVSKATEAAAGRSDYQRRKDPAEQARIARQACMKVAAMSGLAKTENDFYDLTRRLETFVNDAGKDEEIPF